ncbi:uncharacterized protein LOC119078757 isoform X2 [Bradysia coprophila]|nr:uncharacterized protein LOC119078757 isoform X2 [Bradysia coprophila]XP_037042359.1 uncharacterized protein LOC119078757 isoform X2 [Bradysia coprophila]
MAHRQIVLSDGPQTMLLSTNDPFTTEPILQDLIIWIYVGAIVVLGYILNLIMIGVLLKNKWNGTSIFVIQLIVVDLVSLGIATIEILYMNNRKWIFEPVLCPIYLGLDSVTSTASIYFIIAINLHAISTYNLAVKTKTDKQKSLIHRRSSDFQRLNNENYESTLCTQQQRSLTIDYSKKKSRISVMCPIVFTWILSVSVSVPLFTLGVLLPNRKSAMICGLESFNRGTNIVLQLLVLFIRIIIPSLCLIITFLCVAYKYQFTQNNRTNRLNRDVRTTLKLGVVLSVVYILFCTQRVYGSLMFEIMTKPFMQYKYPVFDQLTGIVFCMVNYTIPAVRPFFYLYVDKSLRGQGCRNAAVDM